jgi:hypothetical protein
MMKITGLNVSCHKILIGYFEILYCTSQKLPLIPTNFYSPLNNYQLVCRTLEKANFKVEI